MSIYRREIDTQCCNQWMQGIRTINGQYPDDNRDFDINAGDGIEVTPATGGITIAMKAPIAGPMRYIGTVGTGGTVASLPAADVLNTGWTYVAITAGSTPDDTPKSYAVGDMIISTGTEWTVVPAGDDPVVWSQITGKPTTVSGYGITDAYTKSEADALLNNKVSKNDGDQSMDGSLILDRNIIIPNITSSTLIRQLQMNGKDSNNDPLMLGALQIRRYGNRSRFRLLLNRYMDTPIGQSSIILDVYDTGRIYMGLENVVNGTNTNHVIVDSTP